MQTINQLYVAGDCQFNKSLRGFGNRFHTMKHKVVGPIELTDGKITENASEFQNKLSESEKENQQTQLGFKLSGTPACLSVNSRPCTHRHLPGH